LFKHVIQNFEEEMYNNNLMSLKTLQTFDHVHCPRVNGKKQFGAEHHRNSQFPCPLIDNFEAYIPRQQATYLQSELWILNNFGEHHPPEHLDTNLKKALCHQPFINRIKHVEFWIRAVDGLRKDLETVPTPRGGFDGLSPTKRSPKPLN